MVKYCNLFLGAGLQSAIKKTLNDFYKLLFLQKFKYLSKVLFFLLLLYVVNIERYSRRSCFTYEF